jgi:CRP-like cAMP-binding protein
MPTTPRAAPVTNRLLAALSKKEYQQLLPELTRVTLTFADILYEPGDRIRDVYFPENSIVSLLAEVGGRSTLEVGIVGNEGMAGISVFMGVSVSRYQGVVQGAGTAMKMKAAALHKASEQPGALRRLLHNYTHSLMTQISQSAACNRFHVVEARLARWLLMTRDRVGADEFRLTQEFMSHMLGVRREGVSNAAGALRRGKLISYSRGQIRILDGAGLEAVSCECYSIAKDDYRAGDGHHQA